MFLIKVMIKNYKMSHNFQTRTSWVSPGSISDIHCISSSVKPFAFTLCLNMEWDLYCLPERIKTDACMDWPSNHWSKSVPIFCITLLHIYMKSLHGPCSWFKHWGISIRPIIYTYQLYHRVVNAGYGLWPVICNKNKDKVWKNNN